MYKVIKKKINLNDIYHPDIERCYSEHGLEELIKSIEDNGWVPNFDHLSYHGDSTHYYHPFVVIENFQNNGLLMIPKSNHRVRILIDFGYKIVEAYVQIYDYKPKYNETHVSDHISAIAKELKSNQIGMFQSFEFDYGIELKSRDDSKQFFYSTEWHWPYYIEKNVLDIACNGGYFALEAKRNGARKVIGFDFDPYMINKANQFKDLLDLDVDFSVKNFWDFNWDQTFDIVFCNQCIYHFGNDNKALEALDLICNATTNNLVMYTFITNPEKNDVTLSRGYRPSHEVLWNDLKNRGFKEVLIYHHRGGKQTAVASKQPWKYLYLNNRSNNLVYYNSTLKTSIPVNWFEKSTEELIDLWN